jgi:hypothetical protein
MAGDADNGWRENTGRQPRGTAGKYVRVQLRGGKGIREGLTPAEPWPADGKHGCRWTLEGHASDIVAWRPAG